jgi:fructose/tagatose bisphosphate aldolase
VNNIAVKKSLQEGFKTALNDGWIFIAANVYTSEYFTGVARAMYELRAPAIVQASSDTLPRLSDIHSGTIKQPVPSVNDLLRGLTVLCLQRRFIESEAVDNGDIRNLAIYLALDHSDPMAGIFTPDRDYVNEYKQAVSGTPQAEKFRVLQEEVAKFYKKAQENNNAGRAAMADWTRAFTPPKAQKPLSPDELLNRFTKYLLFKEKIVLGEKDITRGIDLDIDYIALDFVGFPYPINIALTSAVTCSRDYHAKKKKYVLVESGFGIESEKKQLNAEEQVEYADRVLRYVDETGIDAVSCNIGTYHGEMGTGSKGMESLHTGAMSRIRSGFLTRKKESAIIVAHGGSSISDECLKELDIPKLGLVKINKASVYIKEFFDGVRGFVQDERLSKEGKLDRSLAKGFNIYESAIERVKKESKLLFEYARSSGKAATLWK